MSADFKFKGPFQTELAAYISEKRRLGCKYVAEEEIACAFDVLSTDYDCSNGVPKALVDEFTRLKPNWKETTQKKRISFINLIFSRMNRYLISLRWLIKYVLHTRSRIFFILYFYVCFTVQVCGLVKHSTSLCRTWIWML